MKFGYMLPDRSYGFCSEWSDVPKRCIFVGDCKTGLHDGDFWVLQKEPKRVMPIWAKVKEPYPHPKIQEFAGSEDVKIGVLIPDEEWTKALELRQTVQAELVGCGGCIA